MAERRPPPSSPTRDSDLSTVPNTPRPPTPVETKTANDRPPGGDSITRSPKPVATINGPVEEHSSPRSTSSAQSQHDLQLTWPKSIDVTKSTAVAIWGGHRLPNLGLDIHWHPSSHKAFFRLQATVRLAPDASRRGERIRLYIHIQPERIRQLSVDLDPAEKVLGAETLLLKFELDRPPALVLPKAPCQPKNKSAQHIMDACYVLAAQACFSVYVYMPRKKMPVKRIRDLCAAATGAGLASLAVHASTVNLYEGKGGQIIEGDTLAGSAQEPPAYNEPPPPEMTHPALDNHKGKKRRREASDTPELAEAPSLKAFQALLESSLFSLKKDIAEMLDKTEARILDTVRKDMDERYGSIQDDVLESVRGEIAEIEDNVMRNLTEAPMTATITFPQHPLY